MRLGAARRFVSAVTAATVVFGMMSLTGPAPAGACDTQIQLTGQARSYESPDGTDYVDGIVTNTTTQTISPGEVKVSWAETPGRVLSGWICSAPLKPGQWAAFQMELPDGVSPDWTPSVISYADADSDAAPLDLTVSDLASPTVDEDGARTYTATVTNDGDVPVSSVDVQAVERDADSGDIVDRLDVVNAPDTLAPGESEQLLLIGEAPYDGDITPDVRASAFEQPTLKLSVDATSPAYGTPVAFSFELDRADGSVAEGSRDFKLVTSGDGDDWHDYRCVQSESGTATAYARPGRPLYFKAIYWGGDDLGYAESAAIQVVPQLTADAPSAPGKVRCRRSFKVSGSIDAGDKSAGKSVTITVERKRGSRWVASAKLKTSADPSGRYSKSLKLTVAGAYRIRAYRAGVGYTPYKSLKVTK